MAKREIEFTINDDEDATINVEAFGYKGKHCHEDIEELIDGLGKRVETKKKKEYWDKQKVRTHQHLS